MVVCSDADCQPASTKLDGSGHTFDIMSDDHTFSGISGEYWGGESLSGEDGQTGDESKEV